MNATPTTATARRALFASVLGAATGGVADTVAPSDASAKVGQRRGKRTCSCRSGPACHCTCRGKTRDRCRCKVCHGPKAHGRCRCHSSTTTTPPQPTPPTNTGTTTAVPEPPNPAPPEPPPPNPPEPPEPPQPPTDPGIPLIDNPQARVVVSRFSFGVTPVLADEVAAAGGAWGWFTRQLSPESIEDAAADELAGWWPSMAYTPATVWNRHLHGVEQGRDLMASYQRWLLLRRVRTKRQVFEVMTEFWENHLNVPVRSDQVFTHRVAYGQAVRAHSLGRFEDLLKATVLHPAMLIYLGAGVSTASKPNENLGRELLELHTVGRGNYDEDDVKNSARILTGFRVDTKSGSWATSYQPVDHWVGPVSVMDFNDPNPFTDGRLVTMNYLTYLANHPATARRIARKLCVKFVGDEPSDALIELLARTYLAYGTAITPVLQVLVASPEFLASTARKVRDPSEDVIATHRALGTTITRPAGGAGSDHAALSILAQANALGMEPHDWPQPNGAPTDNESWASPSRLAGSMMIHKGMAGSSAPKIGISYRSPSQWLGATSRTLGELVEHLTAEMLVQHARPEVVTACCQAVGYPPETVVTMSHPVMKWSFPRLVGTLLDSPQHMTR